ncbi:hypothetical protein [Treponema sp. OMZ 798]|uniref:hypothetical protein n=1 Tax=Treponema sp. OMZ 798 TaxID=2563671 RepID=UPI0020A29C50|nr:hypothetical protein [Treponema sp. OMZ 798]UTC79190.1 hypothetical protein E4O07_00160 [Treponema sp. OMZ 798]
MNLLCVSSIVTSLNFRLVFKAGLGKKGLTAKEQSENDEVERTKDEVRSLAFVLPTV